MTIERLVFLSLVSCVHDAAVEICLEEFHWLCKWKMVAVSSAVVSPGVVPADVANLVVNRYEGDDQIERFEGLGRLARIEMTAVEQNYTVVFRDMPKLAFLYLDKNNLIYVSQEMFSRVGLEEVYLSSNKISRIENGAFGKAMKKVFLRCNELEHFRPQWFAGPELLVEIFLAGNRLEAIERDAFRDFARLEYIDLAFNRIRTVGSGAFSARRSFQAINLRNNGLKRIRSTVFPGDAIEVRRIDVRCNNLSFIPAKLLERLTVRSALIDGNPWQCPCYLQRILPWMDWSGYGSLDFPRDAPGEPRCVASVGTYAKECVEYVAEEPIECFRRNVPTPPDRQNYCLRKY